MWTLLWQVVRFGDVADACYIHSLYRLSISLLGSAQNKLSEFRINLIINTDGGILWTADNNGGNNKTCNPIAGFMKRRSRADSTYRL